MLTRSIVGAACALLVGGAAQAATINVSTGLDSSGNLQTTGNAADANWTVTGAINPEDPVGHTAYVVGASSADWYSGWTANGPNSSWIAANPNDGYGNGLMTFTRTFDVSNPLSASLTGAWTIDDAADLLLNGHTISSLGPNNWAGLTSFSASGADFLNGANTLTIRMTSADDWLEAGRLEGAVTYTPAGAVPEPASWALMIVGVGGLGAMMRRKRGLAALA